jgi:hypothetical protein
MLFAYIVFSNKPPMQWIVSLPSSVGLPVDRLSFRTIGKIHRGAVGIVRVCGIDNVTYTGDGMDADVGP